MSQFVCTWYGHIQCRRESLHAVFFTFLLMCECHVYVVCHQIVSNPLVALMYVCSICVQCLCDVYKSLIHPAGAVPGGCDVVQLLPQPVHRRGH